MDKKLINQKEYLKKYLSSGKDKKKVKKKKPNLGSKTVTIIDDDIDLKNMRAIEDGEFDIYNTTEDGPQIAGIVDERGPVDFSDKRRWKIITDDGDGDITVTSVARNEKIPDESSPRIKAAASNPSKNHSGSQDSDCSPPRRPRNDSDSEKPRRKNYSKKKERSDFQDSDFSPPRKPRKNSVEEEPHRKKTSKKRHRSISSPGQNRSGSQDSDCSPPRRPRNDFDSEKLRQKNSSKKKERSDFQDSDFSPPRKPRKNSEAEEPRRKKPSKKRQRSISSPGQNRSGSQDSDISPPRRARKNSDSDLSPPRNSKPKRKEKDHRTREEYSSNSEKKVKSKYDKQRENYSRDSRRRNYDNGNSRTRFSGSPSTEAPDFHINSSRSKGRSNSFRAGKHVGGDNSTEYDKNHHRSRQDRNKMDTSRKKDDTASPRNRKKADGERRNTTHFRKGGNNSDSDLSPPRENKKKSRNFDTDTSPRVNSKKSRNLNAESSLPEKPTFKNYQEMSAETSGFGQAPVLRDRKTGRRRDLAAEAREQEEKDGKRQELEEKYAQWGRGLKQVEDRQEKLDRDLYEMSKPLARYADDADLERELKAQDREGDPMLAYMKRKLVKEGKQEPEKPRYNGPSMPNRFGIRPGYRWDGVDRSNGYEKKWFEAQNARKAVQEEAYKWSTADM